MMKALVASLLAAAASVDARGSAEVLAGQRGPWPSGRAVDPREKRRAELRERGLFEAADGGLYPVGPCGFVPKSARRAARRGWR